MLLVAYEQAVASNKIKEDARQLAALNVLQEIYDGLIKPSSFWFSKNKVKGAYLYGAVGTGKTFLLDLFYNNLPIKKKMRSHFYQFMQTIHERLKFLQGQKNPLKLIAKELAKQATVICFDEFFVNNIVDAMLLGNLLQALYQQNITFIATSNALPDELYKGGLQRDRFIPAIDLIKVNNTVIQVDSGIDYRLGKADYDRAYFYPQDPEMWDLLFSKFKALALPPIEFAQKIVVDDRFIETTYQTCNAIWFDFNKLCGIPRSQTDYLILSKQFDYVFLSGVHHLLEYENDLISNFIKLIDVFYDISTKLIILASVPINDIYRQGRHQFEFERTKSRLFEMQSESYLLSKKKNFIKNK
ncbi:MAG: hypothetical protein A3E87_07830 [Gammaproteobacteria bacterium RIFCSPHIGHO2_12_FULL_35_23]|nr:MAG: hypothetical protein A3E87_07830 [Gammaproteobacteria bacterium RIFCSPHIGHO2_12_FULL_35_23]